MTTTNNGIANIKSQLKRLGAYGPAAIECEAGPTPGTVQIYDTQVSSVYRIDEALAALTAVTADECAEREGGGFEAAWTALGKLDEMTSNESAEAVVRTGKLDSKDATLTYHRALLVRELGDGTIEYLVGDTASNRSGWAAVPRNLQDRIEWDEDGAARATR